jgi:predicted RNA binding protein YcfA (HicA-like mRNA interferase family)
MKPKKLLARLARGAVANVTFADMQSLVEGMGFELQRVSGSHHIFIHPDVPSPVNLQSVNGQAKPYQVRQVLRLIERYALTLESEE